MRNSLPQGELVLLCNNGYFVEKVLYTNLRFDPQEILHRSLISVADVASFDAVLQLVSDLRTQGSTSDWPIILVLGDNTYNFTFSGTCMHEHIVLTASVEGTNLDLIPPSFKSQKNTSVCSGAPGKLASEDLILMEKINRLNSDILTAKYKSI